MSDPSPAPPDPRAAIQKQFARVLALRSALYSRADPSVNPELETRLFEAEKALAELEAAAANAAAIQPSQASTSGQPGGPKGRLLGSKTTGLRVESFLKMKPIPTGIYNLLDSEKDPLLKVLVSNDSRDIRRVRIKVYIEGLSAESVSTIEIEPRAQISLNFLPLLFPERSSAVTEVQRATLHIIAEDLDGKPESHETRPVVCLARTASFNSVQNPETGQPVDLTHYYGAWVTPRAELVQEHIRRAADLLPDRMIPGYLGDPDVVPRQVEAIYNTLKKADIRYINSVIDYGAGPGQATQRTRLPRESLADRSANCIDGTVLMASLLEGSSLNAAIVLIPGHAFVGWETWDGEDEWNYLETTMIGSHSFAEACASGQRQFEQASKYGRAGLKVHKLRDLRNRDIWPME